MVGASSVGASKFKENEENELSDFIRREIWLPESTVTFSELTVFHAVSAGLDPSVIASIL
jgi:hypothetical protein